MLEVQILDPISIDVSTAPRRPVEVSVPDITVIAKDPDIYTGQTTVIPSMDPVTLATKDKTLVTDVNVTAIPVYQVSNPEGGTTIYIGGEYIYG